MYEHMDDKKLLEGTSMGDIARAFLNNPLDPSLNACPGIGPNSKQRLELHGVTTANQLVGHFFLEERDPGMFTQFLCELGIPERFAQECARRINQKYGKEQEIESS
jgi:hypothetical protein